MAQLATITQRIFSPGDAEEFEAVALEVFRHQYRNNPVYRTFCEDLGQCAKMVETIRDIPFLPVEVFKAQRVYASSAEPVHVFTSSGTTGKDTSRHYVADLSLYEKSFLECFRLFYSDPSDYCVLALLPGYLERKGSSLIYMVNRLVAESGNPLSGFYLDDLEKLSFTLKKLTERKQKILLFGVSHALADLAERFPTPLPGTVIMETGGMKGRRREIVREELHALLCEAFSADRIHSEYGMTELLSQAYSQGKGLFVCPPWMQVLVREANDPLSFVKGGETGGINVIDLANVHSCSFIATGDLGRMHSGNRFEVLGRFDDSDVRGCSLLLE